MWVNLYKKLEKKGILESMKKPVGGKSNFFIQINDRGGKHFRRYTVDSLQMLFDISPTAANFELMVLIEGMVFMALRVHFMVIGNKKGYKQFIVKNDRLECAIDKLAFEKIISPALKGQLTEYRKIRNEIVHNAFRIKSLDSRIFPEFKNYSYSEAFSELFKKGVDIFKEFSKFIVPGRPTQEEFLARFRGVSGEKVK